MALLVGAMPLSAQDAGEGSADEVHVEIGTLSAIDDMGQWVQISYPAPDDEMLHRTYRTTETTLVEGLGGIMAVGEITPGELDRVVIVQFAREGSEVVAGKLRFPVEQQIHVTRGTVAGIDFDDRQLILQNDQGVREFELDIGYGAMIDTPTGLGDLTDLALAQEVAVYYAEPSTGYLVVWDG